MTTPHNVAEWHSIDAEKFRGEILPRNQPAILRGAIASWPAVAEGLRSPRAICEYLKRVDSGRPIKTLTAPASVQGRFFYREDMRGLNFARVTQPLGTALDQLLNLMDDSSPPAVYMESTPILEHLPGFATENRLDLLPESVAPRIWIGNAVTVQTHFDLNDNVACVVAGRRRFTLFPTDQLPNLYVGPFDFTLSGPPVSMVSLHEPDFDRYPRFKEALEHAQVAELGPGDALYIPYFWWHHVESLESFNVLVNYWWNTSRPLHAAPFDALLHSVLALRSLPESHRQAWRTVFDYMVFQTSGDALEHLKPEARGLLGPMTPERAREIKAVLLRILSR